VCFPALLASCSKEVSSDVLDLAGRPNTYERVRDEREDGHIDWGSWFFGIMATTTWWWGVVARAEHTVVLLLCLGAAS